jgi:hypothetical protein
LTRLSQKDLSDFMYHTQSRLETIGPTVQLVGASKPMTEGQQKALAFLMGSLTIWIQKGIVKEDWESKVDFELFHFNSTPDTDEGE